LQWGAKFSAFLRHVLLLMDASLGMGWSWWKSTFLSRNMTPTAVCNKCLTRNNWQSPLRPVWATALTIYNSYLNT
jgi:hypothetical protein